MIDPPFVKLYVEWLDAQSVDEWVQMEDHDWRLPVCKTIGFLVHKDDTQLALASSVDEQNKSGFCIVQIPKGMIRSIMKLTEGPLDGESSNNY